jgi:hypothetical protein
VTFLGVDPMGKEPNGGYDDDDDHENDDAAAQAPSLVCRPARLDVDDLTRH